MAHQVSRSSSGSLSVDRTLRARLNRRTVLKGAAAGAAVPVFAGATPFATKVGAAQDMANTVVFAVEGSPPTFDPAGAGTDSRVDTPSLNLYNALVQHTLGTAEIEPELATAWEASEDGLSYTFTLRDDVVFHDGTPLTAADVVYSFERLMALKRGSYRNVAVVTGAEAPDDHTVVLTLERPFPALVQALTRVYVVNSELVKANEQDGDYGETWLNDHDAGSGPYVLTAFEPEQQFTIEAFPDYWKGWDGAHVDRAIFRVIKEEASRRLALENAEVDWAMIGSVETFNALLDNPDLQTFSDPTLNQLYFAFNQESEYLRDPKVREALSLVYDYDGHVEQARGGQAEVARGPLPSAIPFFDEAMQPSKMDIVAAKAALAESQYPDGGFSLEMIYQGTSPEETTAVQIMQAGAAELNIEIVPVAMEWPAKVDAFSSPETSLPMATIWIFPGYPDPEQFFYPLLDSANIGNGGVNFSHFSTPETDDLIARAASETDEAARAELYKELQQWWVANRPYMDIVVGYALSAARTWLQGYQWSPTHSFTQTVYAMSLDGKP
jgi:peptide/nickel transport system substrate-binding protein